MGYSGNLVSSSVATIWIIFVTQVRGFVENIMLRRVGSGHWGVATRKKGSVLFKSFSSCFSRIKGVSRGTEWWLRVCDHFLVHSPSSWLFVLVVLERSILVRYQRKEMELRAVGIKLIWNPDPRKIFDWSDLVELGNFLNQLCLIRQRSLWYTDREKNNNLHLWNALR